MNQNSEENTLLIYGLVMPYHNLILPYKA